MIKTIQKKEDVSKLIDSLNKLYKLKKSNAELDRIQELAEDLIHDQSYDDSAKPRITCAGVYNSGKSSLLNALSGTDHFKVGDIPTTATIDELDNGDFYYIDTPGLNANNYDNITARKAFKDADVIIFVSNIQNGGLNAAEAEYLKELSDILGGKENLKLQTIFVLSNLHQINDENVSKVVQEHAANIEKAIGIRPESIYTTDSVTYQNGITEDQQSLRNMSGIENLKKDIPVLLEKVRKSLKEARKIRVERKSDELIKAVNDYIYPAEEEAKKLKAKIAGKTIDVKALEEAVKFCKDTLKAAESSVKGAGNPDFGHPNLTCKLSRNSFYRESSESSAKRRIREYLNSPYEYRERAVKIKAGEIADYYIPFASYSSCAGNFFYDQLIKANKAVTDCNSKFNSVGIHLPASLIQPISIIPKEISYSRSSLITEMCSGVVEYSGYYSLDKYIEMYTDINEDYAGTKGSGWFEKTIYTYSCYNLYEAVNEMEKDLSVSSSPCSDLKNNADEFAKKLKAEISVRKDAMIKSAEEAGKKVDTGEKDKLDALEKELKAINLMITGKESK